MKTDFWKVGWRTGKTVIAVFLCFLIDTIRANSVPFYAAIAAILCIQKNFDDSLKIALTREIATIVGGIFGMAVLLFENGVYCIPNDLLRYLALSILLIPLINFSVWIKQENGTFLMCVVFLCITATRGNGESPFAFGINRIIDTTIGIAVALLVNQFSNIGMKIRKKLKSTDSKNCRNI
ncbi:MAG: aromatic acid exporter family protein [Lachnospiraceae bacterium]|nr:aromatic acid exporter family protein [Lachnospiraceae bacterium]